VLAPPGCGTVNAAATTWLACLPCRRSGMHGAVRLDHSAVMRVGERSVVGRWHTLGDGAVSEDSLDLGHRLMALWRR
jgi:hypothetical protein